MPIIAMKGVRHGAKPGETSSAEILTKFAQDNTQVAEWLTSVSEGTRLNYTRAFYDFYMWLTHEGANSDFKDYTVKQLLDYQERATGSAKVTIANRLNMFIGEQCSFKRPKSLTYTWTTTRSFFTFHGCDLPRRRFTLLDDHKEPAPQNLTYDTLTRILGAAKLRDKTIFTIMFQSGMGMKEFAQFDDGWSKIKPQLEAGRDHLIVNLTARKKARGLTRGFKTVVGRDGVKLLKDYLAERGEPKQGEPIFLRQHSNYLETEDESVKGRSLRGAFERLARRIQLIQYKGGDRTNRYGYSLHQLRDTFKTQWFTSKADKTVVDYLMGHSVDSNEYLKFGNVEDYLIRQYKMAEEKISPFSNPTPELVKGDEVEALREKVRTFEQEKQVSESQLKSRLDDIESKLRAREKTDEYDFLVAHILDGWAQTALQQLGTSQNMICALVKSAEEKIAKGG
jgi:site-specific recombinase XerD